MKRFVLTFIAVLIGLLGLMTFVDYVVSSGLRKTTIRKYAAWNDIYNGHIDTATNLVILGASCAWCEYNPQIIDSICQCKSYNLGIDGHTFPMYQTRYDIYRKFYDTKNIIINVDMGTLGGDILGYEREQFFPYFWIDRDLINEVKETKSYSLFDLNLPMCRYWGYRKEIETGIMSYCGQKHFEDDGLVCGYRGNDWAWSRASLDLDTVPSVALNDYSIALMEAFIRDQKRDGKNVIIVMNPIYHELLDRIENLEQMDSLYNSISAEYDVTLLDYRRLWLNKDSTCFYNPSHLNKEGSILFSAQVANDLDSLGLLIY